ncbi:MAG: TPM domain-containing protein [Gammaproteobacteria bacterium]|nr:TPM domain-containing protein [Gammaproteobacteria bacterium]
MARLIIFPVLLLLISGINSQAFFGDSSVNFSDIPAMDEFVNDYQGVLSIVQKIELNKKLETLKDKTGVEFVILIVPSTSGEKIRHYTFRAMDAWDQAHNGRSIAVFMTIDGEEGSFFIGTRPSIQYLLPDVLVEFICDEKICPYWRSSEWFDGIDVGVNELINILERADIAKDVVENKRLLTVREWIVLSLLMIGCIYTLICFVIRGSRK